MEKKNERARSKQKTAQTLMRTIPLLLLPLLLLVVVALGLIGIKLLSGESIEQTTATLGDLWQAGKPFLVGSANIMAIPILLGILLEE
jgi:hypothetical protein